MEKSLTHRHELAFLVPDGGICVELGVASGSFSELLLETNPTIKLFSIDRWTDHHDEREKQEAERRLARFYKRSEILHSPFSEAVIWFPDEYFDLIYIDGYAHTGQENGQTLDDWWPKLKSDGIFSGHDYDKKWPIMIEVVDNFVDKYGLTLNLTTGDQYASWWTRKNF